MNEVFLSLGGNKGDRLLTLKNAIKEISVKIGAIQKTSKVYETQPWGSKSTNHFLNQVIKIKTFLNPDDLWKEIDKIEKQFGRKRTKQKNADRTLDIDILFYNREIIESKSVQIPHPRLQLRKFVLLPLFEIEKELIHPVLKKSIAQLVDSCKDALEVKIYNFKKPLYICFEGNIGVGKTTLAKQLALKNKYLFAGEIFEENHLLPLFYNNPKAYAFAIEWSFLLSRFNQILNFNADKTLVCDFSVYKSLWFASINLPKNEFAFYKKHFKMLESEIAKPDLIVYLKTKPENLLENIAKRGRVYEKNIKSVYLEKINKRFEIELKKLKQIPILEITIESYNTKEQHKVIIKIEKYIKENFGKLTQNLYF